MNGEQDYLHAVGATMGTVGAWSAEMWPKMQAMLKTRAAELPEGPRLERWLSFYEDKDAFFFGLADDYAPDDVTPMRPSEAFRELTTRMRAIWGEAPEVIAAAQQEFQESDLGRAVEETLRIAMEWQQKIFEQMKGKRSEEVEAWLAKLEDVSRIAFMVRVVNPCLLYFGTDPFKLMANARTGDREAIETLIILDKSVVSEPAIAEQLRRASETGDTGFVELVSDALKRQLPEWDERRIKLQMAAIVSGFAKAHGLSMTVPEIRKISDAVAHEKDPSVQRDADLPDDDDALRVYLTRYRKNLDIPKEP